MPDVTPIRVSIGLKPWDPVTGRKDHDFPDWQQLPSITNGEEERAAQIHKWVYDQVSGHDDDDVDSPRGNWFGMMLVTPQFAGEAITAFPGRVVALDEAQAQVFWEQRANVRTEEVDINESRLIALKAVWDLINDPAFGVGQAVVDQVKTVIQRSLNPNLPALGIRREKRKTWTDLKNELGLVIVPPS